MKTAYYSRNNSYSRSANAEAAEEEGRFPRMRAAKHLNLSIKAFDAGCGRAKYSPTEWHHVGKYANEVDYYDTVELTQNIDFWRGAITPRNRAYCMEKIRPLVKDALFERLNPEITRHPKFADALIKRCEGKGKMLQTIVRYLNDRGTGKSVFVKYGSHSENEMRIRRDGSIYYTTSEYLCADGGWVKPFNLTLKNLRNIITEASRKKQRQFLDSRKRYSELRFEFKYMRFNKKNVWRIIQRKRDGLIHNNSLRDCTFGEWLIAAKILERTGKATYIIDGDRVNILMNENG